MIKQASIVSTLHREAEAARVLMLNLRDVLAEDDQATEDAIEGETYLKEAASRAVERLAEIDALAEAIKILKSRLSARAERLDAQAETIRAALCAALAQAEIKKLELASATISLKATPAKVVVTDEAAIPAEYWKRGDPKLDRKALLDALQERQTIPGAELSNGGETISIRGG